MFRKSYLKILSAIIIVSGLFMQEISALGLTISYTQPDVKEYTMYASEEDNPGITGRIKAFKHGGSYEFVIPYGCDASEFTFTVYENGEECRTITADLSGGSTVTAEIDENVKLNVCSTASTLPVLYINIDEAYGTINAMNESPEHTEYCYGDIILDVPAELAEEYGCEAYISSAGHDKKPDTPGTMRIRGRGNSTWTTDTDKQRPYQFKLEEGADLLGMGKNKTWALLRAEQPKIYLRNKISYDMARDMGIKYTPRAEMADVFMNGEYKGVYTLTTTVEVGKGSVPITDLDDEIEKNGSAEGLDLTGGYLLEIDNFIDSPQFIAQNNKITVKSPETLDATTEDGSKYDYIKNLVTDVFDAVAGSGYLRDGRHFSQVLDLESAARYFLHQELIGNSDCCQGSTYLYKNTDSKDSMLYMGPVWDCDYAFDLYSDSWCLPDRVTYWNEHPLFVNELCKHKEFMDYVYDLYFNQGIDSIYHGYAAKIDEYAKNIISSAEATSRLYNIGSPTYEYISSYILEKYNFMNNKLPELCSLAPKGRNLVIYTPTENNTLSGKAANVFQRMNTLQYSYTNTTDREVTLLALAYDKNGALSKVSAPLKVAAGAAVTDILVLPSEEDCSSVSIYDGGIASFDGVSETENGTEQNVNPDPFSSKYRDYLINESKS